MLDANTWPIAVHPDLICNDESEADKMARAQAILDIIISDSVQGKKVLDFGCGEGHLTKAVSDRKATSPSDTTSEKQGEMEWEKDRGIHAHHRPEEGGGKFAV
jgi:cyclopropane fatty-acyl-phospholipid synthase-like methyltransferase